MSTEKWYQLNPTPTVATTTTSKGKHKHKHHHAQARTSTHKHAQALAPFFLYFATITITMAECEAPHNIASPYCARYILPTKKATKSLSNFAPPWVYHLTAYYNKSTSQTKKYLEYKKLAINYSCSYFYTAKT